MSLLTPKKRAYSIVIAGKNPDGLAGGPIQSARESSSLRRVGYGVRLVIELQFPLWLKFIGLTPTFNLQHNHLSANEERAVTHGNRKT